MDELELLDWKRRIGDLYATVRGDPEPERAWDRWRRERDELFAHHPQSPLDPRARSRFRALVYFPYDARLRVLAEVEPAEPVSREIATSGEHPYLFTRFGRARFDLLGGEHALELYWLAGYGGGVFGSFADETSGTETYGGGRYLIDTVKGADLGEHDGRLVLDFNFAYNPSCAYDAHWVCPLAPRENHLAIAVRGGERVPPP